MAIAKCSLPVPVQFPAMYANVLAIYSMFFFLGYLFLPGTWEAGLACEITAAKSGKLPELLFGHEREIGRGVGGNWLWPWPWRMSWPQPSAVSKARAMVMALGMGLSLNHALCPWPWRWQWPWARVSHCHR